MQPPALVDPARISHGEQSLSSMAMLKMSAARAVSRELNDIFLMESMIGRASKAVMSTCSMTFCSSSALVLALTGAFISAVSLDLSARRKAGRSDGENTFSPREKEEPDRLSGREYEGFRGLTLSAATPRPLR